MKLYTVVIAAFFLCIFSTVIRDSVYYAVKFEQSVNQEFLSYSAKKFIAQSFKNTCNGKGFNSFEQWKLVCRTLFELESINYEQTFCDSGSEKLMYAKWTGKSKLQKCSGEVYVKIQDGVEYE